MLQTKAGSCNLYSKRETEGREETEQVRGRERKNERARKTRTYRFLWRGDGVRDSKDKSLPIDTAVSCESPVIILTATPALRRVPTASFTPALGGSIMPTRPKNVRLPISEPDANAKTAGREREREDTQW